MANGPSYLNLTAVFAWECRVVNDIFWAKIKNAHMEGCVEECFHQEHVSAII